MNDLLYSIPTLIACAAGYYFSWRYYRAESFTVAVLLLMVCGCALRIYTSSDFFLHAWDERYHALVSKNLILHPLKPTLYENPVLPYDYKNWTTNHIWVHKQPMSLWIMACSMSVFGVNEMALRIPSILMTTLGIGFSFLIGSYFFNKKNGFLTAFFFSINGLIIELTGGRVATDHVDIAFLFFIQLAVIFSIFFVQRNKTVFNLLAGAMMGAAILTKWLPALIVAPIWILLVVDSGRFKPKEMVVQSIWLFLSCGLFFLPWQIYIRVAFPYETAWESSYNFRHITEVLDGQTGAFYYVFDKIRINYGELIYLPLAWFIFKTLGNLSDWKRLAVLIWFMIPALFFSVVKTKMQAYILFTAPALFMITADFFGMLSEYAKGHRFERLFKVVLWLLIALPVRYMIERVKPFEQKNRNPDWVVDLRKINDRKIAKGVLFNYDKPIEAMFYTNLTAYQDIPDENKINELLSQGYQVIINDDGNIPETIRSVEGVIVEKLNNS